MTNTPHTPGPWQVCNGCPEPFTIVGLSENFVATIAMENTQALANAHLIAAATELLEALQNAGELIQTARQYFPKSMHNSDKFQLESVCAAIGKAIAKATGGQS